MSATNRNSDSTGSKYSFNIVRNKNRIDTQHYIKTNQNTIKHYWHLFISNDFFFQSPLIFRLLNVSFYDNRPPWWKHHIVHILCFMMYSFLIGFTARHLGRHKPIWTTLTIVPRLCIIAFTSKLYVKHTKTSSLLLRTFTFAAGKRKPYANCRRESKDCVFMDK